MARRLRIGDVYRIADREQGTHNWHDANRTITSVGRTCFYTIQGMLGIMDNPKDLIQSAIDRGAWQLVPSKVQLPEGA